MKNAWKNADKKIVFAFADDYMKYLDEGKTERLCVRYSKKLAEAEGYVNIDSVTSLKAGDKVYKINRDKNIVLAKIGTEDITKGVNVTAAHIDSPRLDLKQNPVYEDSSLGLFETHYYGGIRKYQWVATPLSLIGTVITGDGKTIEINIGEDESDPVFVITDLLPHLGADQNAKKLGEAFSGEDLNVLASSYPHEDEEKNVKDALLEIFADKYGIEEEDFVSAELEIVPSFKAKSVGLDASMIGAYGQDDRVCSYTALKAILDCGDLTRTSICFLADKEEIGSEGNTGMQSRYFENFVAEIIEKCKGSYSDMDFRRTLSASLCLSADVTAAYDPNYKSAFEKNNSASLGGGLAICKYTGARGKSGSSDASAEFVGKIRQIFNENGVVWQTSELGKVDQGGGGTVAKYIAKLDIDTLDVGVPLFAMHAPFEISSKADVYMAYLGYKAFYEAK